MAQLPGHNPCLKVKESEQERWKSFNATAPQRQSGGMALKTHAFYIALAIALASQTTVPQTLGKHAAGMYAYVSAPSPPHSNSSVIASPHTVAPTHQHGALGTGHNNHNGALVPSPNIQFTHTAVVAISRKTKQSRASRNYTFTYLQTSCTYKLDTNCTSTCNVDTPTHNTIDSPLHIPLLKDLASAFEFTTVSSQVSSQEEVLDMRTLWVGIPQEATQIDPSITQWRMDHLNYDNEIHDLTLLVIRQNVPILYTATCNTIEMDGNSSVAIAKLEGKAGKK